MCFQAITPAGELKWQSKSRPPLPPRTPAASRSAALALTSSSGALRFFEAECRFLVVDLNDKPLVEFICMIDNARVPKRAERSAAGYLPSRAMRYCDALTSATGYGYWVFAPISFRLMWDGAQVFWCLNEDDEWLPLSGTDSGSIQMPDFSEAFDSMAPDYLQGYSPPFLTALPELGGVQIWTGLLAKTRPGWSLNVRLPVNLPTPPGLTAWEGIVETDIWFGPLFNNFRIIQTNVPVVIRAGVPLLQVQPIPQIAYRDDNLQSFTCGDSSGLSDDDWKRLSKVLLPNPDWEARQGEYAVTVRKRRLCPVDHGNLL